MSLKVVTQILNKLGQKGGALTPAQQAQAITIAQEVLSEHDSPEDLAERFQLFLALLAFAVK